MKPLGGNLAIPFPRPVIAAWVGVLLISAVLAFVAGVVELQVLRRAEAIAESRSQLRDLSSLIAAARYQSQSYIEHQLLHGHALNNATPDATAEDVDDSEEPMLASPAGSLQESVDTPAHRRVVRTSIAGSVISPRFAQWTVRLTFVDDRLTGAWTSNRHLASLRRPIEAVAGVQRLLHLTAIVAVGVAVICLLTAVRVAGRWRRQAAAIGLAAAVLVVVAIALQRDAAVATIDRSLLQWLCGAAMVGLALATITPVRNHREGEPPRCPCGYNLTGNVSGICPECGRPTLQRLIDRWEVAAAAIGAAASDPMPCHFGLPRLTEMKSDANGAAARYASALAAAEFGCYRYGMSDARSGPDGLEQGDGDAASPEDRIPDSAGDGDDPSYGSPQPLFCPVCSAAVWADDVSLDGSLQCPACGSDVPFVPDGQEAEAETAEQRDRDSELDSVRVRQVLTERRSLFRMRSYFIALAVTSAVAAGQLGIWCYSRLVRGGLDLFVAGYGLAILGMVVAAVLCISRIRQYNRELAKPLQTEPTAEPDFSTLSDGSQRLDAVAQNLARLHEGRS